MECKQVEKLISQFVKNECTPQEENLLLEHIKQCPECKEELTIQFLLEEGLNHLEAGESFDLNTELEKRLESVREQKNIRKKVLNQELIMVLIDIIGGILIIALIIGLLI